MTGKDTVVRLWRTAQICGPAERVATSGDANPTWRVRFDDGSSYLTTTDAQIGYLVNNPEAFGEVEVTLRNDRIVRIRATR